MIDQIKSRINLIDLARELGYYKGRNAARYRGGTNKSSLSIADDYFFDFGSGVGGDVIDFYAAVMGISQNDAIFQLAERIGATSSAKLMDYNDQAAYYNSQLKPAHIEYLHSRGIRDETISELLIGYCEDDTITYVRDGKDKKVRWQDRITIPYWKNGNVVYFCARAFGDDDKKYMKMPLTGENQHVIWGLNSLSRDGDKLIIAEGAFDAISCYQDGYKILSPITGRFSKSQIQDLVKILKLKEYDITICLDYDPISETGQKASWQLAYALYKNGIDCKVKNFAGSDTKIDLNELYIRGESVQSIISGADDFIQLYIETATESQMYYLARERSLVKYEGYIEPSLFKAIQKAPPEVMIADEIVSKYDLIYNGALGFIEYNDIGVWEQVSDTHVKAYISDQLNRFTKGTLIASILSVVKAKCNHEGEFTANPDFINLKNGMFHIADMELHEHNKSFNSMHQVNYNYDPDCKAPRWTQFIDEIAGGDQTRVMMLQEMFGYCFTQSTKYQKMFFLLGEGANGKSVMLKILEEVIGISNVSHVPITELTSEFQRILLYNKSVNIITELQSRVEAVNSVIKSVVDGERIQGSFKFKMAINFKPYCKLICAGNEMFTTDDVTHGYKRRLVFCKFPMRFEGDKADLTLKDKLMSELSGILIWSLQGLKRLNENGGFTETSDQHDMMNTFNTLSDNTYEFFLEHEIEDFITKADYYYKYTVYCMNSGSKAMSNRKFYEKVKAFKYEDGSIISEVRRSYGRGYVMEQPRIVQGKFNL
jgi:P4 family phage/plasmid primase-like protien